MIVRPITLIASVWLMLAALPVSAIEIQEVVSPEGITAWLVEDHTIPIISMEYEFQGGATLDPAGKEGLSYLVSGLLDEGAGELDALAFQKRLEDLAMNMSFGARQDMFQGSLMTLAENAQQAFELLRLALTEPRFDADAIERVHEQILGVLKAELERPNVIALRSWYRLAFADHPYGRPTKGTPESLATITRKDLRRFTNQNFARDNLIVSVVGDIDAEALGQLLDTAFAGLTDEARLGEVADTVPTLKSDVEFVEMAVPQSVAVFGTASIKRDDPDWYAALIVNYVLGGGGLTSRLMEEVRRKRGLTYGVYTYLRPYLHAGLLMGSVSTQRDRIDESIAVIRDEIKRMAEHGATDEEVKDAKLYLTGSYALTFDRSSAIAGQLTGIQRHGLGKNYIDRRNQYVEAVTAEQIRRVAKRLLDDEEFFWVVVGEPKAPPITVPKIEGTQVE